MHLIKADWPVTSAVAAFSTTRVGGHSSGVYKGLNLGHHVEDDPAAVSANRNSLAAELPGSAKIQWLSQVDGHRVICAGQGDQYPEADASWTSERNQVCAVLSADCLPVLFCDRAGTVVAAAHAGWRGLLNGVLEATIAAMPVEPAEILAWMGPAIGPVQFEVGPEVREGFLLGARRASRESIDACFTSCPQRESHYLANLYQLARERLREQGVHQVYGGDRCTYSEAEHFYSYRRDGQTGRMATMIYLKSS